MAAFYHGKPLTWPAREIDWTSLARFAALITTKAYSYVVGADGDGEGGAIRSQILQAAPDARAKLTEEFLAEQVAGVFGTDVSKISMDTPLNQLGLDSLMAIELMNRVESQLGISVPMGSVLNGPNVRELAVPILEALIENAGDELNDAGVASTTSLGLPTLELSGEDLNEFPLTEGQKGLWFLHQLAPKSPAYNLVYSAKIQPEIDIEAMKAALRKPLPAPPDARRHLPHKGRRTLPAGAPR